MRHRLPPDANRRLDLGVRGRGQVARTEFVAGHLRQNALQPVLVDDRAQHVVARDELVPARFELRGGEALGIDLGVEIR
jgi:hypothetical protein